jgi:hypothetical protein
MDIISEIKGNKIRKSYIFKKVAVNTKKKKKKYTLAHL